MDIVQSSNRIINSFPPLNNITPFTRVDGWSFLEVLEGLRHYIVETLVPEIDDDFKLIEKQLNEWFEAYTKDFQDLKTEWQSLFDDFMANVIAELEVLNDQAVANLITNDNSKTSEALNATFERETGALNKAVVKALAPSAAVVQRGEKTWGKYEVTRIFTHGQKIPGLIEKRYPYDYEKQGTSGNAFRPGAHPETLTSLFRKTGAGVIINADGWVSASTSEKYNLTDAVQIKDGVIYHDFMDPVTYFRGYDALGFKWDGSIEFYSAKNGDTAQTMVDDGVKDSFCFGPALVIDSVKQIIDNPDPGARQILGVMDDGDIIIVSTSGVSKVDGPTYQEAADLAKELGVKHAIPLDGGGSTQTLLNGRYMHPSNDSAPRAIGGSFLLANVEVKGDISTTWQRMELINGFTHHVYSARFRSNDGVAEFSGGIINADPETGIGTKVFAKLPWYMLSEHYHRFPYLVAGGYQQYYDVRIDGDLEATSAAQNLAPRYISNIRYNTLY